MSITNLSLRHWYNNYMLSELNDALDSCNGEIYHINFKANSTSFSSIKLNRDSIYYDSTLVYQKDDGVWGGMWVSSAYSYIIINDGTDVENTALINFLTTAGLLSNVHQLSLNLKSIGLSEGTHTLKVKAIGDNQSLLDSDFSNEENYTFVIPKYDVTISRLDDGVIYIKYSSDNGLTWHDITQTGYIGKMSQIKFLFKGNKPLVITSPTIVPKSPNRMATGYANSECISDNYAITCKVTDIMVLNN